MLDTPITERQFTALAKVAGLGHTSRIYEAVKDVMVRGITPLESSHQHHISYGSVCNYRKKMIMTYSTLPDRIALLQEARG